jgi:hypothetical protein
MAPAGNGVVSVSLLYQKGRDSRIFEAQDRAGIAAEIGCHTERLTQDKVERIRL